MSVQNPPEGYTSVTPMITVKDASAALAWYGKVFNAQEIMRMPGPDGTGVMHGEFKIGNGFIMIGDENPNSKSPETLGGSASSLMIYVDDVDATFATATREGATAVMPPADMFWGDRFANVVDPFGHSWAIAKHIEDVAPEDMARRMAEQFANAS